MAVDDEIIETTVENVVFSSIESKITLPKADYIALTNEIKKKKDCSTVSNGEIICSCDDEFDTSFPTINF